jgi:glycerophosphoryl diester phosphodiesterase
VLVLAHRGAPRLAPENTRAAVVAALERGADGVELDVHGTADGVLVVRHDAETPAGPIADLRWAALERTLPGVPTLEEVLPACGDRWVNVEVKAHDPATSDALTTLLAGRPYEFGDRVLVSSFDLATIDRVRAALPWVRTGYLSFGIPPDELLVTAVAHGHDAVHPAIWSLEALDVGQYVARAHALGVQVNTWTVNDAEQVALLRKLGIDAVITDDDDLYRFGVRGARS